MNNCHAIIFSLFLNYCFSLFLYPSPIVSFFSQSLHFLSYMSPSTSLCVSLSHWPVVSIYLSPYVFLPFPLTCTLSQNQDSI